jgi:YedE family putative selenium metabolism protein
MLLRSDDRKRRILGVVLLAAVGAGAAALVALGNPGNMGVCGACFLRDLAGAIGLSAGPAIFRPEVAGVLLGATMLALVRRSFVARSGSHAVSRFALGVLMAIGALVFLGCPFRMLQRLGGGDLNAWIGLPGFVAGVGLGLLFERRGYSVGRTIPVPAPVGLVGPLVVAGLLAAFLAGGILKGPGPGAAGDPPHAPWGWSLSIGLGAGVLLSLTGFCAVTAGRQVFRGPRATLFGALAIVAGYAVVAAVNGKLDLSTTAPVAHTDALWNVLALALVGLCGALAGGCPVRQMTMAGEGNGDAFVTVAGLVVGGAVAHAFKLVSAPTTAAAAGGPTDAGKTAVVVGLALAAIYGFAMSGTRGYLAAGAVEGDASGRSNP